MFVTDTTDAVYPPEDYTPEAIMDRLAEIMLEHSHLAVSFPMTRQERVANTKDRTRRQRW